MMRDVTACPARSVEQRVCGEGCEEVHASFGVGASVTSVDTGEGWRELREGRRTGWIEAPGSVFI